MSDKMSLARLKKGGKTFEISINPQAALQYKKGEISDLQEVLEADIIFTDAKKGLRPTEQDLEQAFGTIDPAKIADIILKEGHIQETAQQRSQDHDQHYRKLITLIQQNALDPRTGAPHPPERIEIALEQAKIHLDDHKTVEEQFDAIMDKLRPLLPLKTDSVKLIINISEDYATKTIGWVKSNLNVKNEKWNIDGSVTYVIELPSGRKADVIDKLNSLTKGDVFVTQLN